MRYVEVHPTAPDIPALTADIEATRSDGRIIIGLAGPPASGKSTLAQSIVDELNRRNGRVAVVLPMDGFHLSSFQLHEQDIAQIKGAPETFDVDGLIATLSRVRLPMRTTVYVPDYIRTMHEPIAASIAIKDQTKVVIVEGNYLLLQSPGWRDVRQYLDQAWFLNVDWDVCRERLVARQVAGGRSPDEAREWVDRSDKANYDLIVSGSKTHGVGLISST
jgi:pantothenate kinase